MKRIFYILLYLSNFSFSQEIKTNADTIIIGDHITINIKAEFKNSEEFIWPDSSKLMENKFLNKDNTIEIIEVSKRNEIIKSETKFISQNIIITSFVYGNHLIPSFIFNSDSSKKTDVIMITVNKPKFKEEVIHTIIGCTDSTAINYNPLANQENQTCKYKQSIINKYNLYTKLYQKLVFLINDGILLSIILTVILLILIYYIYSIKKNQELKTEEDTFSADEIALIKLKKIQTSNLIDKKNFKEYHSQISLVVREYLEARFHFYALEIPTNDILKKLGNIKLDSKDIQRINTILKRADNIKYAKGSSLELEDKESMSLSIEFIKATKEGDKKEDND